MNRLDHIVVFRALGTRELREIIDIELDIVQQRIGVAAKDNPFSIHVTASAKEFLLSEGTDVRYGRGLANVRSNAGWCTRSQILRQPDRSGAAITFASAMLGMHPASCSRARPKLSKPGSLAARRLDLPGPSAPESGAGWHFDERRNIVMIKKQSSGSQIAALRGDRYRQGACNDKSLRAILLNSGARCCTHHRCGLLKVMTVTRALCSSGLTI